MTYVAPRLWLVPREESWLWTGACPPGQFGAGCLIHLPCHELFISGQCVWGIKKRFLNKSCGGAAGLYPLILVSWEKDISPRWCFLFAHYNELPGTGWARTVAWGLLFYSGASLFHPGSSDHSVTCPDLCPTEAGGSFEAETKRVIWGVTHSRDGG